MDPFYNPLSYCSCNVLRPCNPVAAIEWEPQVPQEPYLSNFFPFGAHEGQFHHNIDLDRPGEIINDQLPLYGQTTFDNGFAPDFMINSSRFTDSLPANTCPEVTNARSYYGGLIDTPVDLFVEQGYQHSWDVSYHENSEEQEDSTLPSAFQCKWQGCSYKGSFGTIGSLDRHVRSMHTSTQRYRCSGCGQGYGRRDKLRDHEMREHALR